MAINPISAWIFIHLNVFGYLCFPAIFGVNIFMTKPCPCKKKFKFATESGRNYITIFSQENYNTWTVFNKKKLLLPPHCSSSSSLITWKWISSFNFITSKTGTKNNSEAEKRTYWEFSASEKNLSLYFFVGNLATAMRSRPWKPLSIWSHENVQSINPIQIKWHIQWKKKNIFTAQ